MHWCRGNSPFPSARPRALRIDHELGSQASSALYYKATSGFACDLPPHCQSVAGLALQALPTGAVRRPKTEGWATCSICRVQVVGDFPRLLGKTPKAHLWTAREQLWIQVLFGKLEACQCSFRCKPEAVPGQLAEVVTYCCPPPQNARNLKSDPRCICRCSSGCSPGSLESTVL